VRFAGRLLGSEQGEAIVRLAGQAVRGVALGVVGTALIQALVGGLGLAIAGVPAATVLTVVMFLLGIAQIGPLPVLLSAVAWLFWSESSGMGAFLLTWSVIVGTLDNVVRPILIRKGANLPLLLVFAGVLGGLISFGLIGLFVGPVVLAVAHTLLRAWMEATPSDWAASVR
jgi:predicted PurR-regulated permease PerM